MKQLACAFTGPSNSGKTTLIEKISTILNQNYKVCIIKHDAHDKAIFDKEGKDSYRHFQTGADVCVVSPNRTTLFSRNNHENDIQTLAKLFGEFDYLLVEGLKHWPLPRIGIFRNAFDAEYQGFIDVLATDGTIPKEQIPPNLEVLGLNDPQAVIGWIDANAQHLIG